LINPVPEPNKSSYLVHTKNQPPAFGSSSEQRKTSASGKTHTVTKPERRKTIKTYGSSREQKNQINNPTFENSSEFDQPVRREEKIWDIPASVRDSFAQHEPLSMFPDPSSTIPDNTFTQRRMIEEALTADQLLPQPNLRIPPPSGSSVPSIPWSDYLTQGVSISLRLADFY
jgi:hypothetical protein